MRPTIILCVIGLAIPHAVVHADDWARFRGTAGTGVAAEATRVPINWTPTTNVAWKTALPGPGASSPIIVGEKVLVTCYSGYGVTRERQSDIKDLVRHLVCVDLANGKLLWQQDVKAWLPEDSYYQSGVSSHGYASHTPCSDGTNVYCFFGKGGVHAFDLNGQFLWSADAGMESDPPKWGSSSSPVLHGDTLIVTAAAERQSIIAFDTRSGRIRWQQEATGLDGMWGTPLLVEVNESRTDVVMLVAGEVWGLDPESGKLRWYAQATDSQQAYASVIAAGQDVFAFSGQGGLCITLDGDASGDVSGTHTKWVSGVAATYATPILHRSKLYVVSRGVLTVIDANTGRRLDQKRLRGARRTGNARFGSLDYASPVIAGGHLYYLNASGQTFVFDLDNEVESPAVNEVTTKKEIFWGTPAVSNSRMILRSSKQLYCVAEGSKIAGRGKTSAIEVAAGATNTHLESARSGGKSPDRRRSPTTGNDRGKGSGDKRPDRPRRPPRATPAE